MAVRRYHGAWAEKNVQAAAPSPISPISSFYFLSFLLFPPLFFLPEVMRRLNRQGGFREGFNGIGFYVDYAVEILQFTGNF